MIVIMGPGSCGTTFLIQVLDALGFDTGGGHLEIFRELRHEIREQGTDFKWPHTIKGTGVLCHELKEKADLYGWDISYIFICYRQLIPIINSKIRKRQVKDARRKSQEELEELLKQQVPHTLGSALHQAAFFDCPVAVVKFPRAALDLDYLYGLLKDLGVSREQVSDAVAKVFDPNLVTFGG